jgi:hypothetical protein
MFFTNLGIEPNPIYVKKIDGSECIQFDSFYSASSFFEKNDRYKDHIIFDSKGEILSINYKIFKETEINSSSIDWQTKKEEYLTSGGLFNIDYNVNKAKELLKRNPRSILEFNYKKHLDLSDYKLPRKYNHANLDIPIILGQNLGDIVLIDGLHRLQKAIKTKIDKVFVVLLSDNETEEISE